MMEVCGFCRLAIDRQYFRVASVMVCPACVEKERVKDIATKSRYIRRGILYAIAAAVAASLLLWGVDELSTLGGGGNGLFSGGAFLRGMAVILTGRIIGATARSGAKRRGSRTLQTSVFVLTYLAYAMSFVWFAIERTPSASLTPPRVSSLVLWAPYLPWLMILKNPLGISGIVVVTIACLAAWNATAELNVIDGPFDSKNPMSEKVMFGSVS